MQVLLSEIQFPSGDSGMKSAIYEFAWTLYKAAWSYPSVLFSIAVILLVAGFRRYTACKSLGLD
jgi:hypothetical protein